MESKYFTDLHFLQLLLFLLFFCYIIKLVWIIHLVYSAIRGNFNWQNILTESSSLNWKPVKRSTKEMKKMVQQQPRFDEAHICVMKSLSMDKSMSPPCQFHNTGFIYFKPKIISLNKTSEVMEKKLLMTPTWQWRWQWWKCMRLWR